MGPNQEPDATSTGLVKGSASQAEDLTRASAVPDTVLVLAVLDGDESSFELLFERHKRRVGIIAGRFFQQQEQVQEIIQESFTKAYFALKDFTAADPTSFAAWLSRIAFNVCYDELRRRRRSPESSINELTEQEKHSVKALCSTRTDTSIETLAVSRDLANKLLNRLSAEDRLVLVLLDVEGLTISEIAELMSWSSAKVKIRAFRARAALRSILKKFL